MGRFAPRGFAIDFRKLIDVSNEGETQGTEPAGKTSNAVTNLGYQAVNRLGIGSNPASLCSWNNGFGDDFAANTFAGVTRLNDETVRPTPPDGGPDLPSSARFRPVSARTNSFPPDAITPCRYYPPNPFLQIETAITHTEPLFDEGEAFIPEERVSLADVIPMLTINATWVNHSENEAGSIEAGKYADLAVLDRNLFDIDVHDISETQVLLTLFGGEAVHGSIADF
jgi:hypothetical protein